ncbi:MAG: hypothetical protein CG441_1343 [Methylococcaceae bacterium NSM2-1]|nr:MAG: hypothetical protein CG441_1343 [Methylococcaceae bacterium NSM2-1]
MPRLMAHTIMRRYQLHKVLIRFLQTLLLCRDSYSLISFQNGTCNTMHMNSLSPRVG